MLNQENPKIPPIFPVLLNFKPHLTQVIPECFDPFAVPPIFCQYVLKNEKNPLCSPTFSLSNDYSYLLTLSLVFLGRISRKWIQTQIPLDGTLQLLWNPSALFFSSLFSVPGWDIPEEKWKRLEPESHCALTLLPFPFLSGKRSGKAPRCCVASAAEITFIFGKEHFLSHYCSRNSAGKTGIGSSGKSHLFPSIFPMIYHGIMGWLRLEKTSKTESYH